MRSLVRIAVLLVLATSLLPCASWAEGLRIYAAGSLNDAFTDMIGAFPVPFGSVQAPVFGPSGLSRERIEHGEIADILASADMAQPRKLVHAGQPVILLVLLQRFSVGRGSSSRG